MVINWKFVRNFSLFAFKHIKDNLPVILKVDEILKKNSKKNYIKLKSSEKIKLYMGMKPIDSEKF